MRAACTMHCRLHVPPPTAPLPPASTLQSALPQVLDRPAFTRSMLEKLVWICAFMLVGARHGGCTVGEVEAQVGWGGRCCVGWGSRM